MGWVARSLASGHGFNSPFLPTTGPTALVPPLFPYLLALVFRTFGIYTANSALVILSLDSLFSALTCIPIYLSLKHAADERTARSAAWLWAIYPFSIYFSAAQVWDYSLTSLLFATCFCFAQRLHLQRRFLVWCGFGVLYGVTALSNPSILSLFPFLLMMALRSVRRVGDRWLLRGIVTVIALIVVVGAWTVRNDRVMHVASPIRDGFWLEFWAGNNGDTSESNPSWAHPASNPVEMQKFEAEGETAYLAHKHTIGVNFVHHHPISFAGVSFRRAARFWTGFWSFRPSYLHSEPLDVPNVFFCTSITFFMLRGIRRWWKVDRRHAVPYLILLIVFPLPYYLTHSSMDYRQPIEPEIVMLVTIGLFGIRDWTVQQTLARSKTPLSSQLEPSDGLQIIRRIDLRDEELTDAEPTLMKRFSATIRLLRNIAVRVANQVRTFLLEKHQTNLWARRDRKLRSSERLTTPMCYRPIRRTATGDKECVVGRRLCRSPERKPTRGAEHERALLRDDDS
jgi:Dolichyl-phosphate-mannose-protein mannosyltransferase